MPYPIATQAATSARIQASRGSFGVLAGRSPAVWSTPGLTPAACLPGLENVRRAPGCEVEKEPVELALLSHPRPGSGMAILAG